MKCSKKTLTTFAEYCNVNRILQSKPAKSNFKGIKLDCDKFNLSNTSKKYSIMPAKSKEDKRQFSNLFADEIFNFPKSQVKNPDSTFNKCKLKISKIILKQLMKFGWSKEIIKDSNGKILGGFGYVNEYENLHIGQLALTPSKRNKQETKEILIQVGKRIKEIAKENDAQSISCQVVKEAKHLVRLYKKVGFEESNVLSTPKSYYMQAPVDKFGKEYF